jgi:hypothetical protein
MPVPVKPQVKRMSVVVNANKLNVLALPGSLLLYPANPDNCPVPFGMAGTTVMPSVVLV